MRQQPMKKTKWSTKKPHILKPDDKRLSKYKKQLSKGGFCDSETWSLDSTIIEFTLPRLKRYHEIALQTIEDDKFINNLTKIIEAFEIVAEEEGYPDDIKQKKVVDKGMKLFHKNFFRLWW